MPHFRRIIESRADLLTFQFNLSSGSFVVELASCGQDDVERHRRADLELKTVTAHDMNIRRRLGSSSPGGDHWFVYGKRNYEPGHEQVLPDADYERIAHDVVSLLDEQAVSWWQARR